MMNIYVHSQCSDLLSTQITLVCIWGLSLTLTAVVTQHTWIPFPLAAFLHDRNALMKPSIVLVAYASKVSWITVQVRRKKVYLLWHIAAHHSVRISTVCCWVLGIGTQELSTSNPNAPHAVLSVASRNSTTFLSSTIYVYLRTVEDHFRFYLWLIVPWILLHQILESLI
jgi:hypothetical protein